MSYLSGWSTCGSSQTLRFNFPVNLAVFTPCLGEPCQNLAKQISGLPCLWLSWYWCWHSQGCSHYSLTLDWQPAATSLLILLYVYRTCMQVVILVSMQSCARQNTDESVVTTSMPKAPLPLQRKAFQGRQLTTKDEGDNRKVIIACVIHRRESLLYNTYISKI